MGNFGFTYNTGAAGVADIKEVFSLTGDPTGFPEDSDGQTDRTSSVISFDKTTRTFTIAPTGSQFIYLILGVKQIITSPQNVIIDDVEDKWYIYYDRSGVLTATQAFSVDLILKYAIVAQLYWNATDKELLLGKIFDERHGSNFPASVHLWVHKNVGTRYDSGLSLTGFTIGNGSLDTHAQFAIEAGTIYDEDLKFNNPLIDATTQASIVYQLGAVNIWRETTKTGFKCQTAGTGRIAYNNITTYAITEATNNYFVCYHTIAFPGEDVNSGLSLIVMGVAEYATLDDAELGAVNEVSYIKRLPAISSELFIVGTVIYQTNDTYANAVKSKIVVCQNGLNYLDWRFATPIPTSLVATDHDALNPKLAGNGISYGHINDQAQTIHGAKTFNEAISASNLSGTNTGDNATNSQYSGLAASKVDQTTTINTKALSTDIVLNQDEILDGTTYKQYSDTEKTKLAGIATGATANAEISQANIEDIATVSTDFVSGRRFWQGIAKFLTLAWTWIGAQIFNSLIEFQKGVRYTGIITPATLAANANNYAPTGLDTCNVIRQDVTANRNITGIAAQENGRAITFLNISSSDITFQHQNAGSLAANRFFCPNNGNFAIRNNGGAILWYDLTSRGWRVIGI